MSNKQEITRLLNAIDEDLKSIAGNLEGDAENAPASTLKMSVRISIEHLRVNRQRIQRIKEMTEQD